MSLRFPCCFLYYGLTLAAATAPSLSYSTYLRDSFTPSAIATGSAGNIYLAGGAIVDPVTSQMTALVMKLNPQTGTYTYVRFLGGSVTEYANAIAGKMANIERSFVARLDPNGQLVFSTLLGPSTNSYAPKNQSQ